MAKEYYHDLLIPELIRYAKLQKMNPEQLDEYGAAIFSVWYTQNAPGRPERELFCNVDEPAEPVIVDKASALAIYGNVRLGETPKPKRRPAKSKGIRFTVHSHPNEPLIPSPDDLRVYQQLEAEYIRKHGECKFAHFLTDGFLCRKVDTENEY